MLNIMLVKEVEFKTCDHVTIWKYKNIFAKSNAPNWPENVFLISKVKTLYHAHTLLMISMVKKVMDVLWKRISDGKSRRINNEKGNQEKKGSAIFQM